MEERILIIAKTYPSSSKKYGEPVCTAGIKENGELIRIYPVDFRNLKKENKYKKYQWIEVKILKDKSDPRNESYKIVDNIKVLDFIDTRNNWQKRKELILKNKKNIYKNKEKLLKNTKQEKNQISLAIFKANKILNFCIENVKEAKENSSNLFEFHNTYKLPFKFYYKFIDDNSKTTKLQIIDWELGELTRKLLRQYKDKKIIKKILKEKYFTQMMQKDIYLFLGTNRIWHIRKSPNPFMIIGIFYPPKN